MSSNTNQWFWDWGYLAIAVAVLLGFWVMKGGERDNQDNVNPQVFEAFKKIEADCRAEPFETQSKQCVAVFKHQAECKQFSSQCNSQSFYDLLKGLGYELPVYYQASYMPK